MISLKPLMLSGREVWPLIEGGKVTAEVVNHGRGDKVTIIKMRRRKHYRRQAGHRQWYTEVKIKDIIGG